MAPDGSATAWKLRFGANVVEGGGVEFRVWAPKVNNMAVRLPGERTRTVPMVRNAEGEFSITVEEVGDGADYEFFLEGQRARPDPVSRCQPEGVHGPSRVVNPASFQWADAAWKGLSLKDFVIYELHTGTFTQEGTFESLISRLEYLRDLGITAVELMPVAQFPGNRNWGYDGASLYAPQSSYGGPLGLKKLINACHGLGLAVVLDVVYNHLGPEGNYLPEFAPCFTDAYRTPWGKAINFDGPESDGVRRFFIDNALYWLNEYHVDALRLDAIHGIYDFSAHHILDEMSEKFHGEAQRLRRRAWLIAESDLNDVRILNPRASGGYDLDSQWHDDFHHSLYTLLTRDRQGYLMDFGSMSDMAKSIREGFVYDGRYSRYRRRRHGNSSKVEPGEKFTICIQNHDQVANASKGERLPSLVSREQQKLAAAVVLCCPFLPLIFMGQEYGETAPFLFFTSFGDAQLVAAVREGRKKELADYYADKEFPDPQSEATFQQCRLDWSKKSVAPYADILRLYRDLLSLRRKHACLGNCRKDLTDISFDEEKKWLMMTRSDPSGGAAMLICNFSASSQSVQTVPGGDHWKLALWTGHSAYGSNPSPAPPPEASRDVISVAAFTAALYLGFSTPK